MAGHTEFWAAAAAAAPVIAILHAVAVRGMARAYAAVTGTALDELLRRATPRAVVLVAFRIYARQLLALLYLLIYAADVYVFVVAMNSLLDGRDDVPPVVAIWILTVTLSVPALLAYGIARVAEFRAAIRVFTFIYSAIAKRRR